MQDSTTAYHLVIIISELHTFSEMYAGLKDSNILFKGRKQV